MSVEPKKLNTYSGCLSYGTNIFIEGETVIICDRIRWWVGCVDLDNNPNNNREF